MAFLDTVLEPPSYGYERDGKLYVPTSKELFNEFFSRMKFWRSRKNWLPAFGWATSLSLFIPFIFFAALYFSWPLAILGFVYSMIVLGTHGTIWYHRYSTHRAYEYSNSFSRFLVRNAVIKIIPEEVYVVSHYVHHMKAEKPGDPYNVHAGGLYCFLADAIHQPIAANMSEEDYKRTARLIDHTGVKLNTYEQYKKWGSICHPTRTIIHFTLNWIFWYAAFWLIGGHALATAMFGGAFFWAMGVRTFNFTGHGEGKDKRRDGIDFNRRDLSINQCWPGLITGEWHNNHHLYPNGVRAGFLPYQFDPAWECIRLVKFLGGIRSYRDFKEDFIQKHYLPYLKEKEGTLTLQSPSGKAAAQP